MKLAALFLWMLFPLVGYGAYAAFGTPHLLWRFETQVGRVHTTCTYLGWGPRLRTVPALESGCPWLRLFKEHGLVTSSRKVAS